MDNGHVQSCCSGSLRSCILHVRSLCHRWDSVKRTSWKCPLHQAPNSISPDVKDCQLYRLTTPRTDFCSAHLHWSWAGGLKSNISYPANIHIGALTTLWSQAINPRASVHHQFRSCICYIKFWLPALWRDEALLGRRRGMKFHMVHW